MTFLENGLSFEVCGRLCDGLVTPRSASRNAVAFAFIGLPRSACRVSWPRGKLMLGDGVVEQCLEQAGAFGIGGDTPSRQRGG